MSRIKRNLIVWSVLASVVLGLVVAGIYSYRKKTILDIPISEINQAKNSLLEARKHEADIYAAELYKLAYCYYDSALNYWKLENKRIYMMRDHSKSKRTALKSDSLAILAANHAREIRSDSKKTTTLLVKTIKKQLNTLQNLNNTFKLPDELSIEIRGLLADLPILSVCQKNENWTACVELASSMDGRASKALQQATDFLHDYFQSYPAWQQWVAEAIGLSRARKINTIVVDKTAGLCYLYKSGRKIATYHAELGQNWIGDKKYEGDKTTPEGLYEVIEKKDGHKTRYYKALKINYPNEDDKKRFEDLKNKGLIDQRKRIGGMIEIHGEGGKGYHWTDGCVALSNMDMDELFKSVPLNTPVLIVGSLRPLTEIMQL